MDSKINSFNERCYELLKLVPEGKVTTYSEIAKALNTKAWRAVGSAMAKNENLFVIPCHRVVRSDGAIGQYALGSDKKSNYCLMKEYLYLMVKCKTLASSSIGFPSNNRIKEFYCDNLGLSI